MMKPSTCPWRLPSPRFEYCPTKSEFTPIGCTWSDVFCGDDGYFAVQGSFRVASGHHDLGRLLGTLELAPKEMASVGLDVGADHPTFLSFHLGRDSKGEISPTLGVGKSWIEFSGSLPVMRGADLLSSGNMFWRWAVGLSDIRPVRLSYTPDDDTVRLLAEVNGVRREHVLATYDPTAHGVKPRDSVARSGLGLNLVKAISGVDDEPSAALPWATALSLLGSFVAPHEGNDVQVEILISNKIPWLVQTRHIAAVAPAFEKSGHLHLRGSIHPTGERDGVTLSFPAGRKSGLSGILPGGTSCQGKGTFVIRAERFSGRDLQISFSNIFAEAHALAGETGKVYDGVAVRDRFASGEFASSPRDVGIQLSADFDRDKRLLITWQLDLMNTWLIQRAGNVVFRENRTGLKIELDRPGVEGVMIFTGRLWSQSCPHGLGRSKGGELKVSTLELVARKVGVTREVGASASRNPCSAKIDAAGKIKLGPRQGDSEASFSFVLDEDEGKTGFRCVGFEGKGKLKFKLEKHGKNRVGGHSMHFPWAELDLSSGSAVLEGNVESLAKNSPQEKWVIRDLTFVVPETNLLCSLTSKFENSDAWLIESEDFILQIGQQRPDGAGGACADYAASEGPLFSLRDGVIVADFSPRRPSRSNEWKMEEHFYIDAGVVDLWASVKMVKESLVSLRVRDKISRFNHRSSATVWGNRITVMGPLRTPDVCSGGRFGAYTQSVGGCVIDFSYFDRRFHWAPRKRQINGKLGPKICPVLTTGLKLGRGNIPSSPLLPQRFMAAQLYPNSTYHGKQIMTDIVAVGMSEDNSEVLYLDVFRASEDFSSPHRYLADGIDLSECSLSMEMNHGFSALSANFSEMRIVGRHYTIVAYQPRSQRRIAEIELNVTGAFRDDQCALPGGRLRSRMLQGRESNVTDQTLEAYVPIAFGGTCADTLPKQGVYVLSDAAHPLRKKVVECHGWICGLGSIPGNSSWGRKIEKNLVLSGFDVGKDGKKTLSFLPSYKSRENAPSKFFRCERTDKELLQMVCLLSAGGEASAVKVGSFRLDGAGDVVVSLLDTDIEAPVQQQDSFLVDIDLGGRLRRGLGVIERHCGSLDDGIRFSVTDLSEIGVYP